MIKWLLLMTLTQSPIIQAEDLNNDVQRWMIVNDSVMGGRSESNLVMLKNEEVFRFIGRVSLENNGGFASVRAVFPPDYFSEAKNICIRVRGDGKRYQLRLRGGRQFDGIAFAKSFDTVAGEWQDHKFSVDEFTPTFRGRKLSNVRDIRPDEIRQVTFMISDKQVGEFQLDFTTIRPCNSASFI